MKAFRLDLRLTCFEDLHIGSGLSELGVQDAGCAVDPNGKPWVPHTTLMGLMREGCRKVIEDRRSFGEDVAALAAAFDRLFTYANGDSLLVEPLRFSSGPTDPWITHAFTAVDFEGRVKDHTLRTWQCVRRDCRFEGQIFGTATADVDLDLLKQGLQRIRRWGGGRNRGMGLAKLQVETTELARQVQRASPPWANQATGPGFLLWKIRLDDLTSVAKGATAGNIQFGRDYIRGENVWGAWRHFLRTRLRDHAKAHLLDESTGEPSIIFSNLLPIPKTQTLQDLSPHAVIPAPRSLKQPSAADLRAKTASAHILNLPPWVPAWPKPATLKEGGARDGLAGSSSVVDSIDQGDRPKMKKVSGYVLQHGNSLSRVASPLVRNLRNAVDPASGNVRANQLFTEDSLPAGSTFFGWAYFADADRLRDFLDLFAAWLPEGEAEGEPIGLGRGRKCARIAEVQWWSRPVDADASGAVPDTFNLMLLSDTIAINPSNGLAVSRLNKDQLGLLWPELDGMAAFIQNEQDSEPRHRMHGSGGFFTEPEPVLLAGTVYRCRFLDVTTDRRQAAWQKLRQRAARLVPVGDNTALGYGQWTLDHPVHGLTGENADSDRSWMAPQYEGLPADHLAERERLLRAAKQDYTEMAMAFSLDKIARTKLSSLLAAAEIASDEADWSRLWDTLDHHASKSMETLWNRRSVNIPGDPFLNEWLRAHYGTWTEKDRFVLFLRFWLQELKDEEANQSARPRQQGAAS